MNINDIPVVYTRISKFNTPLNHLKQDRLVNLICSLIENETGLTLEEIAVKEQYKHLVEARQLIIYFLEKYTAYSHALIGAFFNRTHAMVTHSKKQIKHHIETEDRLLIMTERIKLRIEEYLDMHKIKKERKMTVFKLLLTNMELSNDEYNEWIVRFSVAI